MLSYQLSYSDTSVPSFNVNQTYNIIIFHYFPTQHNFDWVYKRYEPERQLISSASEDVSSSDSISTLSDEEMERTSSSNESVSNYRSSEEDLDTDEESQGLIQGINF